MNACKNHKFRNSFCHACNEANPPRVTRAEAEALAIVRTQWPDPDMPPLLDFEELLRRLERAVKGEVRADG
jgi:hypothetical protein